MMQADVPALICSNAEAFGSFWAQQRDHLYRICLRALNGNHADAEEALSLAMLKTWERLPRSAHEVVSPRAWTSQVTRNVCMDLLRGRQREARKAERLRELAEAEADCSAAASPGLPGAPLPEGMDAHLWQSLECLPARLGEVFRLRVFEELSCGAIALRLGLTTANVRKRFQQARTTLRHVISQPPDHSPYSGVSESTRPVLKTARRSPAAPPGPTGPTWEITVPTAFPRAVRIRLRCQVERYYQICVGQRPVRERQRLQTLRAYIEKHPRSRKKLQELARLLYQTGAWLEAIRVCRRALAQQPCWLEGSLKLGEMLFLTGEPREVVVVYERALPLARQPASQQHLRGLSAFCRGDFPIAAEAFQQAASLERNNPAHWHALARARLKAGQGEAALQALEAALKLDANDGIALSLGHGALLAAGRAAEAWERVNRILALAPDCLLALQRLAQHRCQSVPSAGEAGLQTKRIIRAGLKAAPDSLALQASLAHFRISRGERQTGLRLLRHLAEQNPNCARCRRDYLQALALAGDSRCSFETATLPMTSSGGTGSRCTDVCEFCLGL